MTRLLRHWRCHRSLVCCQHVDGPMCNSAHDRHWLGRWRWRRHAAREARR